MIGRSRSDMLVFDLTTEACTLVHYFHTVDDAHGHDTTLASIVTAPDGIGSVNVLGSSF
jgi:hypothetical protein